LSDYESERLYQPHETLLIESQTEAMKSEALALVRVIEILGKTVVAIEPDKGAFDHPSAGEDVEAGRMVGTLEDFDGPLSKFGKGVAKRLTGEGPVDKHMAQPGKEVMDRFRLRTPPITILHVGSMDFGAGEQPGGVTIRRFATPTFAGGRLLTFCRHPPGSRLCRARGQFHRAALRSRWF
jgi:hypothetical protein